MASLQTLRNKGGVIVAIVIAIALLAFLLGDLLTSGSTLFGGNQQDVAEINGTKISNQEYAGQVDYFTEIQKISQGDDTSSEEQTERIRNQAWEMMIRKYALKPELMKLGLTVSETEMADLIAGRNISPMILQMFSDPQTGQFSPEYLRAFISNIDQDPSGRLQMFWTYIQSEVMDQSMIMKFKNLVDKASYVTSFEAKQMASIQEKNYSVRFIADRYETIADSTITVTDAEARKCYEINKNMFRQVLSHDINYVAFEAIPSEKDYAAADSYFKTLAEDFKSATDIQQFASLNSQSPFDSRYYKEGQLTGDLGTFAFTATTDQVYGPMLNGDQWVVARVSAVKVLPDSINMSHIVVSPDQQKLADSLAIALKGGADFAAAAAEYSLDQQTAQSGGLIGSMDPQTLAPQFADPLYAANKGDIKVINTPQSIHIIKVNNRIGDSKKVQLAVINYKVEPSEETRGLAFAKANSFLTAAGNSEASFNKVVNEQMLAKRTATVRANERNVQGLVQSHELARWALNGKKGEVSKVLEFGDTFVVANISTIREDGIAPFEQVKADVEQYVRREKKGQILAEKFAGATSVDELSTKTALPVIEGSDISFQTFIAPEVGYDPAFAGGITGMNPEKISKPIIGRSAVYMAQITGEIDNPISVELEKARLTAEAQQRAFTLAYQAFLDMTKITDMRYKFY